MSVRSARRVWFHYVVLFTSAVSVCLLVTGGTTVASHNLPDRLQRISTSLASSVSPLSPSPRPFVFPFVSGGRVARISSRAAALVSGWVGLALPWAGLAQPWPFWLKLGA